jgi:hypothetical protein
MINAKLAIRIAANVIDAETQFERPVFQTRCFDQQPGHKIRAFRLCKT